MQVRTQGFLTRLGITTAIGGFVLWGYRQWKLQNDKTLNPYDPYRFDDKHSQANKKIFSPWFARNFFQLSSVTKFFPYMFAFNFSQYFKPNTTLTNNEAKFTEVQRSKYFIHPAYFTAKPSFALIHMNRDLQSQKKQKEKDESRNPPPTNPIVMDVLKNSPSHAQRSSTNFFWQQIKLLFNPPQYNREVLQGAFYFINLRPLHFTVFNIMRAKQQSLMLAQRQKDTKNLEKNKNTLAIKNLNTGTKQLLDRLKFPVEINQVKVENKRLEKTETKPLPQVARQVNTKKDDLLSSVAAQNNTKRHSKLFQFMGHHKAKHSKVVDLHEENKHNCCIII